MSTVESKPVSTASGLLHRLRELHERQLSILGEYEAASAEIVQLQGGLGMTIGTSAAPATEKKPETNGHHAAPTKGHGRKPAAQPKSGRGRGDNEKTLRETILEVLKRPEAKKGMKVAEIAEIIEKEKLWHTTGRLGTMVQNTIYQLKSDKLVERGENMAYTLK